MIAFADRVYAATKRIPRGKVSTYGEIAQVLGTKAYRAVGQALHRNPYAPIVPCHRVVASDGSLHGFAHGLQAKQRLLEQEGISITKNRIDLDHYFYPLSRKKSRF